MAPPSVESLDITYEYHYRQEPKHDHLVWRKYSCDRFSVHTLSFTFCASQFSPFDCPVMASVILYSVCAIIAITSTVSGEEGGTCTACNCQFNNVEVLDQLIESKIASGKLATTTVKLSWC